MIDGIIKGTGNSRNLKSVSNFLSLYPTYGDFAAALIAGTLPIDLAGINADGWQQLATALSKGNLLSDATAAKYFASLTGAETVDQVLSKIGNYNVGDFEDTGASNEFVFKTRIPKIKTSGDNATPIIRITGFRYGDNQIIDLSMYFYIYSSEFIKAAYVNNGAFVPRDISYSFYTDSGVDYVAINIRSNTLSSWTYMHVSVVDDNVINGRQSHNYYEGWTLTANDSAQYASIVPQTGIVTVEENSGIARTFTGSYTGTGTFGSANPNSLIFPFEPKVLFVFPQSGSFAVFIKGKEYGNASEGAWNGKPGSGTSVTFIGKTVSWYVASETQVGQGMIQQCNMASIYRYIAFG